MIVKINGKLAVLKKGTSFDYISENRLFSGSDGYSLTISFPLADCQENVAIFGHINRIDVTLGNVAFDCEIRSGKFFKRGTFTITEISESEAKGQFLEGRSAQNFRSSRDNIYIDELELGYPYPRNNSYISCERAWSPQQNGNNFVALPWVNNNTDSGQPHNFAIFDSSTNKYVWDPKFNIKGANYVSWQPYLLYIAKKIATAPQVGYTADFSAWENHPKLKWLLVCNTLPPAWEIYNFARALPHWTVSEFFEKLELFLNAQFDFDESAKSVKCTLNTAIMNSFPAVALDRVIDEHTAEVKSEDQKAEYLYCKNFKYKDRGDSLWKYECCPWYVTQMRDRVKTIAISQLLTEVRTRYLKWDAGLTDRSGLQLDSQLINAYNVNTYYILKTVGREKNENYSVFQGVPKWKLKYFYNCLLQPVNIFGPHSVSDAEDAQEVELEFIPVRIDETDDDHGFAFFLECGSYDEDSFTFERDDDELKSDDWYQTSSANLLENGDNDGNAEYFSEIFVGFWDGNFTPGVGKMPTPIVYNVAIDKGCRNWADTGYSLALGEFMQTSFSAAKKIDSRVKFKFSFLSDEIPEVKSVFIIGGKRFLCSKITATFTEFGMSQLLKGEFYPIVD